MKDGPKDWMPGPKPHRLSDEDRTRLEAIWKRADDGYRVPAEDTAWASRTALALDRPAFEEFRFPTTVGLINEPHGNAFWMRWKNKELIRHRWESLGGLKPGRHVVLDYMSTLSVYEAILVVRPYVRLELPERGNSVTTLRRATLGLAMEEFNKKEQRQETTTIIPDDPLDDHLICPDGKVFRKLPYAFSLDRLNVFHAGLPVQTAVVDGVVGTIRESVKRSDELGFFIPHGTRLIMCLDVPDAIDENVALFAGLVASRYSTQ